ncbi:lysozyme inhibitor LprI family protein [Dokdonia sp. 4H-3-7-5]|uniref:lysozyme inhibitor LprI family protein n=1 Tax=Dokdonia sp. (strain 4H-3-7-5) TaxID=983548 RepID=UPI000A05C061|nr:lysozyme inhibitor LprI family protein [Dokdonia sp. 4H-3-7-5]
MKNILAILILTLTFNCFSQTQAEMNKNANKEYRKADKELNIVYQKILSEYQLDSFFIDRLKKTQRIWNSYRDAELEMKFPADNKQAEYGSVYPMCVSLFLKELTVERTEKLRVWLNGIEEGNMWSGSVKTKKELDFEYVATKKFVELKLPDSLEVIPNKSLIADFNGDLKPDVATLVKNKRNSKIGVLIVNHSNDKMFVFGAGKEVDNMTDLVWIEIFKMIPKGEIVSPTLVDEVTGDIIGQDESKNFELIGNGIYMSVEESHRGGILFWSGKEYNWYHME